MSGSSSGLGEDSCQEQVRFWESDHWGQEELTNHGFIDRSLVYPEVWTDFAVSSGCVFPIKTLSKSKARRWRYLLLLPAQKKTTAGRRTRFFFCKFVCSGSTGDPIYQCQKGYRFTCMALFKSQQTHQQNQPIEVSTRTVHTWWRWQKIRGWKAHRLPNETNRIGLHSGRLYAAVSDVAWYLYRTP